MTTTSPTGILRKSILQLCMLKQQSKIDDFRSRIRCLLEPEGLGNEESYDNNSLAGNLQAMAEVNGLNEGLTFANEEMNILMRLEAAPETNHETADLGAIVETDRGTFFVSTALEPFDFEGRTFSGLSAHSPLFRAMHGKKPGEKFWFKGKTYKVTNIS
jgi:hypothetical protein